MTRRRKKIMIAAGGTGGHLFPAQALADELTAYDHELLFAGASLSSNKYFNRDKFLFYDVASATPFRRSIKAVFQAFSALAKGIREGSALMAKEKPDLVVGFGSFHSFAVLMAARLKKIPFILFESNAFPGKVNRLFSRWAMFTAVYFPGASCYLRGKVVEVEMPARRKETQATSQEARHHFGLEQEECTLFVFGGSQGAAAINHLFVEAARHCVQNGLSFQVIHITGNQQSVEQVSACYAEAGIAACVKAFESQVELAYRAADLVVSRSGAATISELIAYEVPSILIPYPHAADDHQKKNAEFLENEVQGAIHFREEEIGRNQFHNALYSLLNPGQGQREKMEESLKSYKGRQKKENLCTLIHTILQSL